MNILFFLTPKSEVEYIYDDFSLRQTLEKMEHHKYTAIPILNRSGAYIGTITEGDLLRVIKDKYSLTLHEAIEDLVMTAMRQNFVPVVDDEGKFIGIITRKDILEYCFEKLKGPGQGGGEGGTS